MNYKEMDGIRAEVYGRKWNKLLSSGVKWD